MIEIFIDIITGGVGTNNWRNKNKNVHAVGVGWSISTTRHAIGMEPPFELAANSNLFRAVRR